MAGILPDAGSYRKHNNIRIGTLLVCDFDKIKTELQKMIDDYYKQKGNPFEAILCFHYEFEKIHPFLDGNGRTGRELMNYMLREQGYPEFLIQNINRSLYMEGFEFGDAVSRGFLPDYGMMIERFAALMIGGFVLEEYGLHKVIENF
jgi:Fic family protein